MTKQIGNLVYEEIVNKYDSYGNMYEHQSERKEIDNYGHSYFDKDLSGYLEEDRELWNSNPNPKSIPRLYLTMKYDYSEWLSELEIELAVIYEKCKDVDIVKEFICTMIEELKIKLEEVKSYVISHQFKDGVRNTTLDYDKAQEEMYGLYDKIKELEDYLDD